MSTQSKSIALFMKEGSSDKEYHVLLLPKDDGWVVDFKNGRRGKALRHNTKTETPLDYATALALYEQLVARQIKKGYTENEDGRTFQDVPDGKEHGGVRVQLLDEIDIDNEDGIEALMRDPNWVLQQKHDGERRPLVKKGDRVFGAQREGWIVPLAGNVAQALQAIDSEHVILDGEDMGDHVVIFDILHLDEQDLRESAFDERNAELAALERSMQALSPEHGQALRFSYTARTYQEKHALFEQARLHNQEGLVFKDVRAPYAAGKSVSQFKVKFRKDATCQVIERHATKRSASIAVLSATPTPGGEPPQLIPVGNVTLPPSVNVAPGDLIDVRYLYAYEGGSLFQPVYKRHRTDKVYPDLVTSLKCKAEDVLLEGLGVAVDDDSERTTLRERAGMRG